jgi:hypothetical protein
MASSLGMMMMMMMMMMMSLCAFGSLGGFVGRTPMDVRNNTPGLF